MASSVDRKTRKLTSEANIIPGLVLAAFVKGSWHSAPTPELVHFFLAEDMVVDAKWRAMGSSIYSTTASGQLKLSSSASLTGPVYEGLSVQCSCPDGDRQQLATLTDKNKRLFVCKHAASALSSVMDPVAIAAFQRLADDTKKAYEAMQAGAQAAAEAMRRRQDDEMPGE